MITILNDVYRYDPYTEATFGLSCFLIQNIINAANLIHDLITVTNTTPQSLSNACK